MVSPDSDRVSRVRPYSGTDLAKSTRRTRDYHPVPLSFPEDYAKLSYAFNDQPYNPENKFSVWAIPISLAATRGISFDFFSFAYLDVSIRQVSPSCSMNSNMNNGGLTPLGFPIRKSLDHSLFPAPQSLSQVGTSFITSRCQGIHQQLLIT